jgi:hypothetical protein
LTGLVFSVLHSSQKGSCMSLVTLLNTTVVFDLTPSIGPGNSHGKIASWNCLPGNKNMP